jgi:acetyltransferase-like isoleucine patch superfamily enzyme
MWNRVINKLKPVLKSIVTKKQKSISSYHVHPTAILYNSENILLDATSLITEFVIVRAPLARLKVGKYSQIGSSSVLLTGQYGITIGEHVMIAPHCVMAAGNHEYRNLDVPMMFAGDFSNGPIVIEDDVWIGANCTIADNVTIGKGSIISANSLVNKSIEPYSIAGGVPCKVLSSRLQFKKQ